MCALNSPRPVNSMECYMDELLDCFEDYFNKSLVLISVAVGVLVLMLGYVLKVVTDRTQLPAIHHQSPGFQITSGEHARREGTTVNYAKDALRAACQTPSISNLSTTQEKNCHSSMSVRQRKSSPSVTVSCLKKDCKKITRASPNTGGISNIPSFDEKVLQNVGLSTCSRSCMQSKQSLMRNSSATRINLRPRMPTCLPNHHLAISRPCSRNKQSRGSCCSMCCADDDRR